MCNILVLRAGVVMLLVMDQSFRLFQRSLSTFVVGPLLVSPSCIHTCTYFLQWQSVGGTAIEVNPRVACVFAMCRNVSYVNRVSLLRKRKKISALGHKRCILCLMGSSSKNRGKKRKIGRVRSQSPISALLLTSCVT